MKTVDEYLQKVTPAQRAEFERIRRIVKQLVPEVEEVISYGIPTFKYKGTYVLYFGAFKRHMSIFPGSALTESVKLELGAYKLAKGTVQFTEANPIPEPILKKIILHRLADIAKNA